MEYNLTKALNQYALYLKLRQYDKNKTKYEKYEKYEKQKTKYESKCIEEEIHMLSIKTYLYHIQVSQYFNFYNGNYF